MYDIGRIFKENKPYPQVDESVLYYLCLSEGRDFEEAILCLRQAVREWHKTSQVSLGFTTVTFLVSLASVASGVGAWIALPAISAVFTGTQAWGSRKECQVRERELELLKSHPELLELMHQAYLKSVPPIKLINAYNAIVGAFDTQSGTCQGTLPVEALAGHLQSIVTTEKQAHQAIDAIDIPSLPKSSLYPHLPASAQSSRSALNSSDTDNNTDKNNNIDLRSASPVPLGQSPLDKWLADSVAGARTPRAAEAIEVDSHSDSDVEVPRTPLHPDPLIDQIIRAVLNCLKNHSAPCTYVKAVDGYKFWRIVVRASAKTNISSVLKLSDNLFSEIGGVLIELNIAPLVSQVKGGAIAIDVAKPEEQWRTAYFKDYIVPARHGCDFPVRIPVGVDLDGFLVEMELSKHETCSLLAGGLKGGGKSRWAVAAIASIVCQYHPDAVKLILSDTQKVEFEPFKDVPHLRVPIAQTNTQTIEALQEAEAEMSRRERLFAESRATNIDEYNSKVSFKEQLPRIIIFIEETADISCSDEAEEFNHSKDRLNRLARKWGLYLVDSTQSPRPKVVPQEIRDQYAAFLAFRTSRPEVSRIILGNQNDDACRLLGQGDCIYMSNLGFQRLQSIYLSNQEVSAIVNRVIAEYGSFSENSDNIPNVPNVQEDFQEQNLKNVPNVSNVSNVDPLEEERTRLEDALNLEYDGDWEVERLFVSSDSSDSSVSSDETKSDPDWYFFEQIRDGRKLKWIDETTGKLTRKSKTKICQELFGCSTGGTSRQAAVKKYDAIRDKFLRIWIIDLLKNRITQNRIIEEVYCISVPKQINFRKQKPQEWKQINETIDSYILEYEYESENSDSESTEDEE